ncbi:hypothetical protein Btru_061917 [Bulinus truncatus]|nr:hypothetical protein Btru_061917 [Bulinus truncatus]
MPNKMTCFKDKWLSEPKWFWLCSTTNDEEGWCLLCKQTLHVRHGTSSLYAHASTKKHKISMGTEANRRRSSIDVYKEELCESISQLFDSNRRPVVKIENLTGNYQQCCGQGIGSSPSISAGLCSSSSPSSPSGLNPVGQPSGLCSPAGNEDRSSLSKESQIQLLKKEINVLKKCTNEKALLCETTGDLEFIKESNVLRKIVDEKSQLLKTLKLNVE